MIFIYKNVGFYLVNISIHKHIYPIILIILKILESAHFLLIDVATKCLRVYRVNNATHVKLRG